MKRSVEAEPQDPFADHTAATTIKTYKGNTWAIRMDSRGEELDLTLAASPFVGAEIGKVVLGSAGTTLLESEQIVDTHADELAKVHHLPLPTPSSPADVAIGAVGG